MVTRDEFISRYCERSKFSWTELQKWGMDAYPCRCGEDVCQGWQMLFEPPEAEPPASSGGEN